MRRCILAQHLAECKYPCAYRLTVAVLINDHYLKTGIYMLGVMAVRESLQEDLGEVGDCGQSEEACLVVGPHTVGPGAGEHGCLGLTCPRPARRREESWSASSK